MAGSKNPELLRKKPTSLITAFEQKQILESEREIHQPLVLMFTIDIEACIKEKRLFDESSLIHSPDEQVLSPLYAVQA